MRQIVLDTETTGLEVSDGHRIIEIGCVELVHRRPSGRTWQRYLRPEREVEAGALAVHGITNEFLAAQPRFADVAAEFLEFVTGAELLIHNAAFDVGFLDEELKRAGLEQTMAAVCRIQDTLLLARASCTRASATAWTRSASVTAWTTRTATCMARCWTPASWSMSTSR